MKKFSFGLNSRTEFDVPFRPPEPGYSFCARWMAKVPSGFGGGYNVRSTRSTGRFGDVIEVIAPDGRGVRFGGDGNFIGLLEPPL